ncbi:MAG: M48 family metallopeptidase [Pirellulales bacterium]
MRLPPTALTREILATLTGHIEPVRCSLAYQAAIGLVFLVMLLLPLVYVGMIVGVGYGIYLYAVHGTWLFTGVGTGRSVRVGIFTLLLYLGPLAVGIILLLFMCKPLFARPARREKPRSLTRRGEPLLFAFVEKLAAVVGAPCPSRIDVDCHVNASASFRRGWLSMLGNDMVLTVGLPLVAGCNLRQLAGVLAHEFGHFAQGWGMRLSYVIRQISHWLTRVVYERDAWDQTLVDWSTGSDYRLQIVLWTARGCVWLTRRALWLLMIVGHAVSGVLLRQMEFDADMHEVRVAGSDAFESTCRRLAVLNVATSGAYEDLNHWFRESRLGDDLPALIMANVDQLPLHVHVLLDERIDSSTTSWLDTHPADSARIARAKQADEHGKFRDERAATALFSDFAALSRTVTFDFYKVALGPKIKISDLHPTDRLLARQQRENAAAQALLRYFQGAFNPLRPVPFASAWTEAPADPRACAARLQRARQQCAALVTAYREKCDEFSRLDTALLECDQAAAALSGGIRVKPNTFSQLLDSFDQVRRVRAVMRGQQSKLAAQLEPFERAAAERMTAAFELLHVPQVAAKIPDGAALAERCRDLLATPVAFRSVLVPLLELRNAHSATMLLLQYLDGREKDLELTNAIVEQMRVLHRLINDERSLLGAIDYPFQHGKGKISVAVYCAESTPASEDLGGLLTSAGQILDRLQALAVRVMSQLALAAEQVEGALRLPPLAESAVAPGVDAGASHNLTAPS